LTAGRAPKREKDAIDFATGPGAVYLPDALPMYKVITIISRFND
jgi:hypothetical protein